MEFIRLFFSYLFMCH